MKETWFSYESNHQTLGILTCNFFSLSDISVTFSLRELQGSDNCTEALLLKEKQIRANKPNKST